MSKVVNVKRPPGTLAERFWSIAKSVGPAGDDSTNPDPKAIVRHMLRILDALSAGEVGDGVSQSTISFLALLRQQEAEGDMSYASPEQARGETLDERSLVFSVGVLMFEELTGRHPFGALNNPRRFARIQKGELGSGVQYFPQVPAELRSVLMKAMGPFPEERYASLLELRRHLERFVSGDPAEARPAQRPQRLKGLPPSPAELLFGAADDQAPTTVRKTPALTPSRGTPSMRVAVPPTPPASMRLLERLAWLGAGAALAVSVTLIVLPSRTRTAVPPAPSQVAGAPKVTSIAERPVAPAAAAAVRGPSPTPSPSPAPAAHGVESPAPTAHGIEPPALPPVAEAGQFDLDAAGKSAMTAARGCLALDHSVSFGAGLMFSKENSVARRVFLSPDEPLSADERKCVKNALMTASAGTPPDHNVVADYRFRFRPEAEGDKFTFALTK